MNFPHNKAKFNSVLLMMSLKLAIKVVHSFWGSPGIDEEINSKGVYLYEMIG